MTSFALLCLFFILPGVAACRSKQAAEPIPAASPRRATITVVKTADQLVSALRSNERHVRLAAHVDLREYASSAQEAGVIFEASSRLESITGACVHPPPVVHGHVPLKKLHSGQCIVQVASGFIGWLSDAAPDVWVHNLYIRGPTSGWANSGPHRHIALQWRPQQAAALWLTNTTVDGGMMGVLFHGASAYVEGVRLRHYDQGLEVSAGADVSLVDVLWEPVRVGTWASEHLFDILGEPGEGSRLRIESCTQSNDDYYGEIGFVSMYQRARGDVVIFTDDDSLQYPDRHQTYFRLQPTAAETDALMELATAPWSELVQLYAKWFKGYYEHDYDDTRDSSLTPNTALAALQPRPDQANDRAEGGVSNILSGDASTGSQPTHDGGLARDGDAHSVASPTNADGLPRERSDGPLLNVSEPSPKREAKIEEWRRRWLRAESLRPRFLSASDTRFRALKAAVSTGALVDAPPVKHGTHKWKPPSASRVWKALPSGGSNQTVLLLFGVMLALVLILALAFGCVAGLYAGLAKAEVRHSSQAGGQVKQSEEDEAEATVVRRAVNGGGEAMRRHRRQRGADGSSGREAGVVPPGAVGDVRM